MENIRFSRPIKYVIINKRIPNVSKPYEYEGEKQ